MAVTMESISISAAYSNYSNASINASLATTLDACSNAHSPVQALGGYEIYRIVIEVFVTGVLCLFGFIGNALCVAVLYRDHDRKNATNWLLQTLAVCTFSPASSSTPSPVSITTPPEDHDRKNATNWLLQTLAVFDTLYLLTCIFIHSLACIHDYTTWIPSLGNVWPYLYPYIWAISSTAQTITVWIVLLVTIDRYVAICRPLNTQFRSVERAKIAVAMTTLLAVVYNIPRFFEREIYYEADACTGGAMVVKHRKTPFRSNATYILVYKTIMYNIFRSSGPLLALIYLNFKLITALRLVHRKQKEMTRRTKCRENLTAMLVYVVSVFIICEMPDTILRIFYSITNPNAIDDADLIKKLRIINVLTNAMLTVNSSVNFIIYCLIGKKFRSILEAMCWPSVVQRRQMEVSETEPLTMKSTVHQTCVVTAPTKHGGKDSSQNGVSKDVQL